MTVYCFNDVVELYQIILGIMHVVNSGGFRTALYLVAVICLVTILVRARETKDILSYLISFVLPIVLIVGLFRANVDVNFQDEFSGQVRNIDDVPIGIALPLVISSNIEFGFLDLIETNMTPAGATTPAFQNVDFFGHAKMMGEVATSSLWSGSYVAATAESYIENCVLPALAASHISMEQIKNSPNLLNAVSSASNVFFAQIHDATGQVTTNTCAAVYANIAGRTTGSTGEAGTPYGKITRLFGQRGTDAALMALSYGDILNSMFAGSQDSIEALFRQNLMINAVKNVATRISPDLTASMAEAESKQFTSGTVAAMVYIKQLPVMRMMFKLVLIGLFPLIGMFFIIQGAKPFLYWSGSLFWISLWLPAQAVIHAAYSAATLTDLTSLIGTSGGYSFNNSLPILKWATETSAIAGGIMVIVPILTGFLLRWAFPALGGAISGMLQASRGLGQSIHDSARESVIGARNTVLGLQADKFRDSMLELGDVYAYQRGIVGTLIASKTNNPFDPAFGSAVPPAHSEKQKFSDYTGAWSAGRSFNAQSTDSFSRGVTGSIYNKTGLGRTDSAGVTYVDNDQLNQGATRVYGNGLTVNNDMFNRRTVGGGMGYNNTVLNSEGYQREKGVGVNHITYGEGSIGGSGQAGIGVKAPSSGGTGTAASPGGTGTEASPGGVLGSFSVQPPGATLTGSLKTGVRTQLNESEGAMHSVETNQQETATSDGRIDRSSGHSRGIRTDERLGIDSRSGKIASQSTSRNGGFSINENAERGRAYTDSQGKNHVDSASQGNDFRQTIPVDQIFARAGKGVMFDAAMAYQEVTGDGTFVRMANQGYRADDIGVAMLQRLFGMYSQNPEAANEVLAPVMRAMYRQAGSEGDSSYASFLDQSHQLLTGLSLRTPLAHQDISPNYVTRVQSGTFSENHRPTSDYINTAIQNLTKPTGESGIVPVDTSPRSVGSLAVLNPDLRGNRQWAGHVAFLEALNEGHSLQTAVAKGNYAGAHAPEYGNPEDRDKLYRTVYMSTFNEAARRAEAEGVNLSADPSVWRKQFHEEAHQKGLDAMANYDSTMQRSNNKVYSLSDVIPEVAGRSMDYQRGDIEKQGEAIKKEHAANAEGINKKGEELGETSTTGNVLNHVYQEVGTRPKRNIAN